MSVLGFWAVAKEYPERIALVSEEGRQQTFGELCAKVNQIARGLQALGLKHGDGVAMVMSNIPEYQEVFLATQQVGLYVTPINYHLTGPEIAYIIDNCEAKVFFAEARFAEPVTQAIAEVNFDKSHCYAIGEIAGFKNYNEIYTGQSTALPDNRIAGQLMLYTSGTTGRPKGVRRPIEKKDPDQAALLAGMMGALFKIDASAEGMHLVTGPLYHAAPGGMSNGSLNMGHGMVLMNKWEPERTLELIEKYKITETHMVPTMFNRLLHLSDDVKTRYDVSSMKSVIHGAAPIAVDMKKAMIDWWGPVLFEYYGATEGGGTLATSEDWLKKPGTVGSPWPGCTIKVLDDDHNELPANEVGTVYMSSMIGTFEYFKDKKKTDDNRAGELFTVGDIGYLDDEGWLFLCDRKADMIISGGVNIYPAEVEKTIILHPKVKDVAVFGVPDEDWGESVQAVVQLKPNVTDEEDRLRVEILAFAGERLAKFKLPRYLDFRDELPRLDTGKLYKRYLKEEYKKKFEKAS